VYELPKIGSKTLVFHHGGTEARRKKEQKQNDMLKCIAISTPGAQFSALAIKDNFRDSIRRVAELGYDAVELHIRNPLEVDVGEIRDLLNRYRLPVPTIGTGQAYGEEG